MKKKLKFLKYMPIYILRKRKKKGYFMLKKITIPTNNTFCGVEFILRGAKKRRAMAVSNAVAINAENGIKTELQAVK